MAKVTLDAETFKALASSTRLTVLRALDERRKTLSELARDLDLNKATVHEHLQLLTAADLIRKRDDEGRKWIYYELTWRGQRLLHPQETTTFNVLLGLSVLAAGGGVAMLGRALGWWLASHPSASSAPETPSPNMPLAAGAQADSDTGSGTTSGTATTGSNTAAPGQAGPFDNAKGLHDTNAAGGSHSFFDDGGTLAFVLVALMLLFALLAWLMRRQVRPGRFNPKAAETAAASEAPTSPATPPAPQPAQRKP